MQTVTITTQQADRVGRVILLWAEGRRKRGQASSEYYAVGNALMALGNDTDAIVTDSAIIRGLNNAASTLEELARLQERVAVLEKTLLTHTPEEPELWTNVYKDGSMDARVFASKAEAERRQVAMFPSKAVRVRVDEDGNLKPVAAHAKQEGHQE